MAHLSSGASTDSGREGELEAAVKRVVSKIVAAIDPAGQPMDGEAKESGAYEFSSAVHGPFEDKYSIAGESINRHFTYTKKSPDFLSREGASGSGERAASTAAGQGVRRAAPPSLLLGSGHRPASAAPQAAASSSLSSSQGPHPPGRAGSLLSSMRGPRQEERKGPIMMTIAQVWKSKSLDSI